jgi:hypothetical protein
MGLTRKLDSLILQILLGFLVGTVERVVDHTQTEMVGWGELEGNQSSAQGNEQQELPETILHTPQLHWI